MAVVHLVVEEGDGKGLTIHVPREGARLGRSSKNDIVLLDELLSRHHCRFYRKAGDGLWVADLGSANQTLVNGTAVEEAALHGGDRILIGNTTLRVLDDGRSPSPHGVDAPVLDLGLRPDAEQPARFPKIARRLLLPSAALLLLSAALLWFGRQRQTAAPDTVGPSPVQPAAATIHIEYEKVQANPQNIFRFWMEIRPDHSIVVHIDDLAEDRHVRKEQAVNPAFVNALVDSIRDAGFFALDAEYRGIQPDIHDVYDIRVTVNRETHRTRVVNRVEPPVFREVRQTLEEFGKNELGLWAIQFSAEKLAELAREAFLQGRKWLDEREIRYGNLSAAVKSFREAEWYLETVSPKPDFYPEIVSGLSEAEELLDERYADYNFRAERAIRLREWENAARELRILLDILPDRSDPRHQDARRKLLDVEKRVEAKRRP